MRHFKILHRNFASPISNVALHKQNKYSSNDTNIFRMTQTFFE